MRHFQQSDEGDDSRFSRTLRITKSHTRRTRSDVLGRVRAQSPERLHSAQPQLRLRVAALRASPDARRGGTLLRVLVRRLRRQRVRRRRAIDNLRRRERASLPPIAEEGGVCGRLPLLLARFCCCYCKYNGCCCCCHDLGTQAFARQLVR